MAFLTSDGRPVFRVGATTVGLASDGEPFFGLPAAPVQDAAVAEGTATAADTPAAVVTFAASAAEGSATAADSPNGSTAGSGTAVTLMTFDGLPIFRIGSTTVGIVSTGETVFGLAAVSGSYSDSVAE